MRRIEDIVGQTLAGKYRIERLIGKGGFGAVFKATHHPIGRTVAVKISLNQSREDLLARFVREARVQADLRHATCTMLLDFGETDDFFYMVQEFVEGHSLKEELDTQGPMTPARAIHLTRRVLEGLQAAHGLGIVHRDIKPANIMLTGGLDGEDIRILDFGIAKVLSADEDEHLTGTGMSLGTPAFMAPEQIRGKQVDETVDLYATGALLFRLCIGHGPYRGESAIDILQQHLHDPVPRLPGAPEALNAVIARAMAKMPDERFRSADEMRSALAAVAPLVIGMPVLVDPGEVTAVDGATTTLGEGMVIGELAAEVRPSRARMLLGVVLIALIGAISWWMTLDGKSTRPVTATATTIPEEQPAVVPPVPGAADAAADRADLGFQIGAADIEFVDAAPPPPPPVEPAKTAPPKPEKRRRMPTRKRRTSSPKEPPDKRVRAAIRRCDCPAAERALAELRGDDAPAAAALNGRFEEACVMYQPGNCIDQQRERDPQ